MITNPSLEELEDLQKPGEQCIGGGYYTFDNVSNRIILDRSLRLVYIYDDGDYSFI